MSTPVQRPTTNRDGTLQQSIEALLKEVSSPPALLAWLLELKLRKSRVRLTKVERERLQFACKKYFRTKDESHLLNAVQRKRKIVLSITQRDYRQFERIWSKAAEATVTKTIATLARTSEPDAREWAMQSAQHIQSLHGDLQARIARIWREPLQRFAQFRCLAGHVGELAVETFRDKKLFQSSRLANALALLHARACLVTAEIDTLIRTGFADGAMARWRTLHEIAVTMAFLSEQGETTAERYLDHYVPADLKAANQYEVYRRRLGKRTLGRRFLDALSAQAAALKGKHGKDFSDDYGWATPEFGGKRVNFSMIEDAVTLSFMRPYYKLASEQVHASARGAVLRSGLIEQDPWRAEMLTGPTNYGFGDTGANAANSLLLATVSLLQVEPTADMNAASLVLARWVVPLRRSFVRAQLKVHSRRLPPRRRVVGGRAKRSHATTA